MPFRRRFRRRAFRPRMQRKHPVWIATAYNVAQAPNVQEQQLFQLVGPEDYTPDYVDEPQRLDRSTLIRTVGQFAVTPVRPTQSETAARVVTIYKGALFIAGDKQIDDAFTADPGQFEITSPAVFPRFCRDFAPMHIFWNKGIDVFANPSLTVPEFVWHPPGLTGFEPWDVRVARKLQGDEALYLLVDVVFLQTNPQDFGGSVDVESRNLLRD